MPDFIKLLPESIANQIAAGEVVQRPASIVKELLENSLDAKADKIQLIIQDAGKGLIQVIDNGSGMNETDARMCFERHATSKITKVDDLFDIHTFGFRGEAMASIAAVARVELKTKPYDTDLGTEVIIEDSEVQRHEPVATKPGTSISVKNLFFNVPARKNFLKSNPVERRHIQDEFIRAAISRPDVGFRLTVDNETVFDLQAGSFKKRVIQLFGKAYDSRLISVQENTDLVKVDGFVASPEMAKKKRGDQYFLANGRFIKSGYFNHAVQNAFEGLIPQDQHAAFFIRLSIDPKRIDVNVHPTKTEVKFDDERSIYSILLSSIKKSLAQHHIAPAIDFDQDQANISSWMSRGNSDKSFGREAVHSPSHSGSSSSSFGGFQQPQKNDTRNWQALFDQQEQSRKASASMEQNEGTGFSGNMGDGEDKKVPFQFGRKFIAVPVKSGLMVINQQRAHERILFEQFLSALQEDRGSVQRKLFPEVVELSPTEHQTIISMKDNLLLAGFDLDAFGKNAIIVNGLPQGLDDEKTEELIKNLVAELSYAEKNDSLSQQQRVAKSLASSACIKSGKILSANEMQSLIDQLFACKEPHISADNKKTLLKLSLEDFDRKLDNT